MLTPAESLQHAASLHQAGRLAEASLLYRRILEQAPDDPDALHLLGLAVWRLGDPVGGVARIRRSIGVRANCSPPYLNLANLHRSLGETAQAVDCLERGFLACPSARDLFELSVKLSQDLAIAAVRDGDHETAIVWWQRCFAWMKAPPFLTPELYELYERLTRIALVVERPDLAVLVTQVRHRYDFPGVPASEIDVFPVELLGFSEWCASAGLRMESWTAPAEPATPKLLEDYPAYLHRYVTALPALGDTPLGVALDAEVEVIQGFYVKDNYESFFIANRQAVLYENKNLHVYSPVVPLVGITPGATAGMVRIPRPHYARVVVDEPGIMLPSTPNYWHFMVEVLPMLMARQRVPELRDLPVYLYDLRGYHYEMLELAGVPRDKVVDLKGRAGNADRILYQFRHAAVPSQVPYPIAYRWLRDTILPQARPPGPGRADPPRRIFLSRRGAHPKHRIANDTEVGERLARHGFQVVKPETLSVLDTVAMMAEAEIVVAPIGAGTANHVFLPPQATWIHLNNPDFFHPDSDWNSQMGTQVTYSGTFRHLTGRFTGDPAQHPERLVDRLEIPVEIDLDRLSGLVEEAEARLKG